MAGGVPAPGGTPGRGPAGGGPGGPAQGGGPHRDPSEGPLSLRLCPLCPAGGAERRQVPGAGRPQDPGNVGTLWRTADAFGADGLILLPGCADP